MISIIIPTLGQREQELFRLLESLMNQTYKEIELIVVSQDNHELVEAALNRYPLPYKHLKTEEKGLSMARNKGLLQISGEYVTFSDDDCWYPADGLQKVMDTFEANPLKDTICFKIYDPFLQEDYKRYPNKANDNITGIDFLRKSSIEIFAKSSCFKEESIRFDERFGLGSLYKSGEENIILNDLKKSGYKIAYEPSVVVYHKKREKEAASNMDIIKKGPLFIRIFGYPLGITLFHMFYLKKWRSIHRPLSSYKSSIDEIKKFKRFDKK
jgi:glycosyltransferase involved in cell wall biosynthesis